MGSYDILFRPPSSSQNCLEYGAYFSLKPFQDICQRVNERATRAGHARLAEASHLYPETDSISLYNLDAAAWKLVIEEVDAMLADADFFAYQNEYRGQEWLIRCSQQEGLDSDAYLLRDRRSAELGLRHLRNKLTEMVERGEGPSPRNKDCERLRHSDILFRPLSYDLYSPAETSAQFYGRPFGEICRRIEDRAVRLGNAKLAEAAKHAQLDGYLQLHLLDTAEWRLVIEEVDAILADPAFYGYETEQNEQAWFVERCQREGQTPEEFQRLVREATVEQLRHLREKLIARC